jgi:hypothetical protein
MTEANQRLPKWARLILMWTEELESRKRLNCQLNGGRKNELNH